MLRKIPRLILSFLIVNYFFLFLSLSVFADWNKYDNNPVVFPTVNGWDKYSVRSPAVIYDNNQFKLYYQGQINDFDWQIGLAYSSDGINWTKESNNPVLTASSTKYITENGLEEATVLKDSLYRIWYKSDYWSVIRYAYSTDGLNWQKYEKYVLGASSDWESDGVANPCVIYKDGKYWMYYTAWGNFNGWLLGLATSTDGINWTKYDHNPLSLPTLGHIGRPAVIILNNQFHLFYHTGSDRGTQIYHVISNDGINFNCEATCAILHLGSSGSFDSNTIIGPAIIEHNSILYLYYGALGNNNIWQIGLATNQPLNLKKTPVIIIPGLFASWNKEALLHNQTVNQSDWLLNPVVHEYDGIRSTLTNLGYLPNQDFYFFYYDWRKGLNSLADDLNGYLNQITNNQSQITNFQIIGHSLGGLVGRVYLQKYNPNNINTLITVGSPHQGAAQTYKAVEGGELDHENNLLWLTQKLVLQINRDGLKTDKQVINEKLPIARDLLPSYDFLKDQNNTNISINNMQIKNDTLISYLSTFPNIYSSLKTFFGEKGNTPFGYKISTRTILDQLLDLYPDGRPITALFAPGDSVVTSESANAGNGSVKLLNLDHGEIISKKDSLKKILDSLAINYQDGQITEGSTTQLFPSLIFMILSPANLEVDFDNQTYQENQGLIFIPNAQSGNYSIKARGQSLGRYTILIGQLMQNNDQWSRIEGEITTNPPATQTDNYEFSFNPLDLKTPPLSNNDLFDELIIYLTNINKTLKKSDIDKTIQNLNSGKQYFNENNFGKLKSSLLLVHRQLFSAWIKLPAIDRPKLLYAIEKLENLYGKSLSSYTSGIFPSRMKLNLDNDKKIVLPTSQFLLTQKNKGKNTFNNSFMLSIVDQKISLADENYNNKKYLMTEILLKSIAELIKEVRDI